MVKISVELSEVEAEALAQFLKRVGWVDWRQNAVNDAEAAEMRAACECKVARVRHQAGCFFGIDSGQFS